MTTKLTDEDVHHLLGTISNALLNGSYMTNANVAMEALCAHLDVNRDTLPFDLEKSREAFCRQFDVDLPSKRSAVDGDR